MVFNHCAYSKTAWILEAGDSRNAELNASAFMFPTLALTLMYQIPVPHLGSSSPFPLILLLQQSFIYSYSYWLLLKNQVNRKHNTVNIKIDCSYIQMYQHLQHHCVSHHSGHTYHLSQVKSRFLTLTTPYLSTPCSCFSFNL